MQLGFIHRRSCLIVSGPLLHVGCFAKGLSIYIPLRDYLVFFLISAQLSWIQFCLCPLLIMRGLRSFLALLLIIFHLEREVILQLGCNGIERRGLELLVVSIDHLRMIEVCKFGLLGVI